MDKNNKSAFAPGQGHEGQGYPPQASSENYPPAYAPQIDPVQNYPFPNNQPQNNQPLNNQPQNYQPHNYQPQSYPPQNGIHNPSFTQVNFPIAVGQPNMVVVQTPAVSLNFMGAIVMSCVVYWLCGAIFGGIAFILAMVGQSQTSNGDDNSGRCMLRASYILSSIGIVAGIAAIIAISVFYSRYYSGYYNPYYYNNGVYVY